MSRVLPYTVPRFTPLVRALTLYAPLLSIEYFEVNNGYITGDLPGSFELEENSSCRATYTSSPVNTIRCTTPQAIQKIADYKGVRTDPIGDINKIHPNIAVGMSLPDLRDGLLVRSSKEDIEVTFTKTPGRPSVLFSPGALLPSVASTVYYPFEVRNEESWETETGYIDSYGVLSLFNRFVRQAKGEDIEEASVIQKETEDLKDLYSSLPDDNKEDVENPENVFSQDDDKNSALDNMK